MGATVPVSSEATLEVQQGGTIRDSPQHELVQIDPTQRDSVQLSGAVARSVRESESDTDSVAGIDRRTRRRLSLVWRSHTTDPIREMHQTGVSNTVGASEGPNGVTQIGHASNTS